MDRQGDRRGQLRRWAGVMFACGPGYWQTRPPFWLAVGLSLACLLLSRGLGWGALAVLALGYATSRRHWRRRERRRLATPP